MAKAKSDNKILMTVISAGFTLALGVISAGFTVALLVGGWFGSLIYNKVDNLQTKVTELEVRQERDEATLDLFRELLIDDLKAYRDSMRPERSDK